MSDDDQEARPVRDRLAEALWLEYDAMRSLQTWADVPADVKEIWRAQAGMLIRSASSVGLSIEASE